MIIRPAMLVLCAATALAHAATPDAALTVHLTGVANSKGKVLAALCDEASFLKQCHYNVMEKAGPTVDLHFSQIPPGRYAVMVFHDENDNQKLDKSAIGMPLEGYGFSRNAKGHWGPPTFKDAAIDVQPGAATVAIELAY